MNKDEVENRVRFLFALYGIRAKKRRSLNPFSALKRQFTQREMEKASKVTQDIAAKFSFKEDSKLIPERSIRRLQSIIETFSADIRSMCREKREFRQYGVLRVYQFTQQFIQDFNRCIALLANCFLEKFGDVYPSQLQLDMNILPLVLESLKRYRRIPQQVQILSTADIGRVINTCLTAGSTLRTFRDRRSAAF